MSLDRPALKGELIPPAHEIEVTPEMIEVGALILLRFTLDKDEREVVAEIYRAMAALSPPRLSSRQ